MPRLSPIAKLLFACLCLIAAWAVPTVSQARPPAPDCARRCVRQADCLGGICSSCISGFCIHITIPPDAAARN